MLVGFTAGGLVVGGVWFGFGLLFGLLLLVIVVSW